MAIAASRSESPIRSSALMMLAEIWGGKAAAEPNPTCPAATAFMEGIVTGASSESVWLVQPE